MKAVGTNQGVGEVGDGLSEVWPQLQRLAVQLDALHDASAVLVAVRVWNSSVSSSGGSNINSSGINISTYTTLYYYTTLHYLPTYYTKYTLHYLLTLCTAARLAYASA